MYRSVDLSEVKDPALGAATDLVVVAFTAVYPHVRIVELHAVCRIEQPRLELVGGRLKVARRDHADANGDADTEAPLTGQSGPRWIAVDGDFPGEVA